MNWMSHHLCNGDIEIMFGEYQPFDEVASRENAGAAIVTVDENRAHGLLIHPGKCHSDAFVLRTAQQLCLH